MQHEAEEMSRLRRRDDLCLEGMQPQPPSFQEMIDAAAPFRQHRRVVVEQREIIHIAGHPERPDWQRDVSASLERIGDVLKDGGDGKAALDNYAALVIAEKLAAGHPERPDWQRDVSVSLERIGDVLKDGGDGKAALENYRRALVIAEKLAAGHPESGPTGSATCR